MIYGIDIGGTKIELVIFDDDLEMVARERVPTPTNEYAAFLDAIVGLVERADANFGAGWPVGLGIPGLVTAEGYSLCANVPAASGKRVAADLAERLNRATAAENDCRLFALSEARGGAGEGYRTVYGAILGTGAAGGLIVDGQLERGRQGIAGEYGHIQLSAALQHKYELPIWPCGCGLPACVESYIAGPGLVALARHFGSDVTDPASLDAVWRAGDVIAKQTRACFQDILGATFATLVMMHDPDVMVLGGGLSLIDDVVDSLPTSLDRHLFAGFTAPPIVRAKFGDSSGVRGAALLVRESLTQ